MTESTNPIVPGEGELPPQRQAFETFFAESRRSRGADKRPTFHKLTDGTYSDDHTQRHWWTWQTALASHSANRSVAEDRELPGPSGDVPSDFQEGQWWLAKLDELAAHDDDGKRAVATVRNLMRTAHAQAAPKVEAPAVAPSERERLLKALHRITAITSASPAMNEQQLGLSMGIIQEVAEQALAAATAAAPTEQRGLMYRESNHG